MPVNGATFHNLSTAKEVTCLCRNNGFARLSVSKIREEQWLTRLCACMLFWREACYLQ